MSGGENPFGILRPPGAPDLRPLRWETEIEELQALVALCHPGRATRPNLYFWMHPTLVAVDRIGIAGYAVVSMIPPLKDMPVAYLVDTGVHPRARGTGLGYQLLVARLGLAYASGALLALGTVRDDNTPMRAIHRELGMQDGELIPGGYTDLTPPVDARVVYAPTEVMDRAHQMLFGGEEDDQRRRWDQPA